MPNDCARHVFVCAMRVARLEANGVPDPGANNLYVTDSLATLTVTPVISEGEEVEVKNACGEVCVNVKDCDRLKRLDLSLGLCYPDPQLLELLTGGVVLTSGNAVGYGMPPLGQAACPNGVSVEVWAKRYDVAGAPDADFPYEHYALPRTYWQHGAKTFENGPIQIELNGFATENDNWFNGPANDWPVASDRVMQSLPKASVPTASCGYQTIATT